MFIKDAKRSIGQAAKEIGVSESVIRYWETQFPNHIKPTVGLGGRRYYYDKDINLLSNIKDFLYTKGYTIKGLQNFLDINNGFENSREEQKIIENKIQDLPQQNIETKAVFSSNFNDYIPKEPETKTIIQKEYVYINKGLDSETKTKLNNFQNNLLNFSIQLENFENI